PHHPTAQPVGDDLLDHGVRESVVHDHRAAGEREQRHRDEIRRGEGERDEQQPERGPGGNERGALPDAAVERRHRERAAQRPATAGPITRAALNADELSAIAFIRSSLPTRSTMNAWRAGMSNALTTHRNAASAARCHTATVRLHTSAASANAGSMDSVCVRTTRRCLLVRSTTTPA